MQINCRARTSPKCLHGVDEKVVYEDGQIEDGTWDGDSVVCDACYVGLMHLTPSGQALTHELDAAIQNARE